MDLVNSESLAETLDAVNEAMFFGREVSSARRERAARWIAARQGLPGAYAGMFAPTERDFALGIRTFTGELIRTGAATAHILGEEACRALRLLAVNSPDVQQALARATEGMLRRLGPGAPAAMYCCGRCTVSLWRNVLAGGLDKHRRPLQVGLSALRLHRQGDGQWRVFPFYYTLLALSEMDLPAARAEMRYAASACERRLGRLSKDESRAQRRRAVIQRILARC